KKLLDQDKALKISSDFCVPCFNIKRSFDAVCKQQGTIDAMNDLKKNNQTEWVQVLQEFARKRSGKSGKKINFDVSSHIESVKKAKVKEDDLVYKPLLLGEYLRHFRGLPPPFTLTESQAIAQWHRDLSNPDIKKTCKEMFNPSSKKMENFTRVHVLIDELEHRKAVVEKSEQVNRTSTTKSPGVHAEYMDLLRQQD
ncbi:unnamed protein product, partial [Symbiodinium sp. CCMP2456]